MNVLDCVFCEILAGREAGSFVHRDELVAGFLTIGPINAGHVLIVPLCHASGVEDLTPAETEARCSP
jgi:histidine triad (HIT) family protein